MKKIIAAIALALFVSAGAFAGNIRESSVPAVVKGYVAENYPRILPVEWDYDNQTDIYTAHFKIDGAEYELDLSPKGELISSEIEIATAQIPASVRADIGRQYPGFKITDAKKRTLRETVTYEVEIEGNNSDRTLIYSESGSLIDARD